MNGLKKKRPGRYQLKNQTNTNQLVSARGTIPSTSLAPVLPTRVLLPAPKPFVASGTNSAAIQFSKAVYMKQIKCITNVYQPEYKFEEKATGIGDFIRGCYFSMHLCNYYKLPIQINYHGHPMAKYMHKKSAPIPAFISNQIERWEEMNNYTTINSHTKQIELPYKKLFSEQELFYYLLEQPVEKETNTLYMCINSYPTVYPAIHHRLLMQQYLQPSEQVVLAANKTWLCGITNYYVVHLRNADIIDASSHQIHLNTILEQIDSTFSSDNNEFFFLILSNDRLLAKQVEKALTGLGKHSRAVSHRVVAHLGDKKTQSEEAIFNTIVDMYILSKASKIMSCTCYSHGSGFSQWIAVTYGIPYVCFFSED